MAVTTSEHVALDILQDKATRLRIDSVQSTTAAGSGHPTSCASAAEIMSVLFYSVLRYDPRDPHNRDSDVFVLSKGHAAPIGHCKVLRKSDQDKALVIAGGITVFEALAAYDHLQHEGMSIRIIDLFSVRPDRSRRTDRLRARLGRDHHHGGRSL